MEVEINYLFLSTTVLSAGLLLLLTFIWGGSTINVIKESKKTNAWPFEKMKKYFVWGLFYSNPNDPRKWVPKMYGYGWTINFKNKAQISIFCLLIVLCLGSSIATMIL